ncbi:MAG: hypothetical protein Greene101449_975, partial [Candidatus Peregrinibacteria bacterium Greene1014_49]
MRTRKFAAALSIYSMLLSQVPFDGLRELATNLAPEISVAHAQTEQFTFTTEWEIRKFINTFPQYTHIPDDGSGQEGAARFDDVTAAKVCELKGFPTVASKSAGSYTSCGDNTIGYFDAALNNFVVIPACNSNVFIEQLTCQRTISTQCSDGMDNDNDGATDTADFSCSSTTDTDETNPKSQCQDGIDNDGDGVIDFGNGPNNDPGCGSLQDNDEGPANFRKPVGYLDAGITNCDMIRGWTCDADNFNQALQTHIYDGPAGGQNLLGIVTADKPRESQVGIHCGGNSTHGYEFPTPASLKDGQPHQLYAYGINIGPGTDNSLLTGSPVTITCAAPGADLRISKTGPSSVPRTALATYTVTVTNDGPGVATNVKVEDSVPAGIFFNPGVGDCTLQGNTIVCTQSSLNPGQSKSFTISFTVPGTYTCNTTVVNRASVTATSPDPNASNNQSQTVSTTVTCPSTPQCQDGIDNDGDGAVDFPGDFSCGDPGDDDEGNPKSQCQDGIDNDADGVIDFGSGPNN